MGKLRMIKDGIDATMESAFKFLKSLAALALIAYLVVSGYSIYSIQYGFVAELQSKLMKSQRDTQMFVKRVEVEHQELLGLKNKKVKDIITKFFPKR